MSGDWRILAGTVTVVLEKFTVAVMGANEEMRPLARILNELVEPAAEDRVENAVAVVSMEETKAVPDVKTLKELDASWLVPPSPSVIS